MFIACSNARGCLLRFRARSFRSARARWSRGPFASSLLTTTGSATRWQGPSTALEQFGVGISVVFVAIPSAQAVRKRRWLSCA
eukprot:867154-Pleurochrysis_carterae.AAC.1